MDVPEKRTLQHTETEGEVRNDNAAHMELDNDNRQDGEERPMDREQEGPATKKVHREQQGRTDSTQPKQKREVTKQIEELTTSNDGSRHKITRTTKEPATGKSTDTEERDS